VSSEPRPLLSRGWARATLALLLVLAVTGALAAIFYRPYGPDPRAQLTHGHWGLRVALAIGLHHVHRLAALGLTLTLAALIALRRPWQRQAPGRGRWLAATLALAAFVATGLIAPWERLLPWSPTVASNLARPMPLGQQGPFAELIGVNMRYDDAQFRLARRRFGPKATGRVYFFHVLILPALAVIGASFAWRPRRREPDRA
jgi:quinol-cytochrome oxidoreductase complex cytochrome b subunit